MTAAISITDLSVRFGAVTAVDGVSLDVEPGCIVGLIGPNGAGKTTVLDAISGLVPATGSISMHGTALTRLTPAERARLGLGRSFQDGRLYPSLTVREALCIALSRSVPSLGYVATAFGLARRQERAIDARARELAESFGLTGYLDAFVAELSTGTRRIVDLASVVGYRPSVLLLDEPSSGIAQREAEALGPRIRAVRDLLDCTILIVEHDMPLVTSVCDELVVMEAGQVIARDTPSRVVVDPRVVEAYLGFDQATIQRSGALKQVAS